MQVHAWTVLPPSLWVLVIEVFHSLPNRTDAIDLTKIDHVPSSGTPSGSNAMLYVFEDNEQVIKMIMKKGRRPTVRHVSRTHRVALVRLFDRIYLDSKIQIRYIDTKHQLADFLTEGNVKYIKTKYQIVESRSTNVRTTHECDTQLLYGASGPTVSEDGSYRASDTCALQGYVQMCMRSTLCSGDRHTTGIPTKS